MNEALPNRDATRNHPDHKIGGYRSWMLRQQTWAPFDMLWIHDAKTDAGSAQLVMPHCESSIGVQRFFDPNGNTEQARLVVCGAYGRAKPYFAPPRSELIAVRVKPELAEQFLSLKPAEYADHGAVDVEHSVTKFFDRTRRSAASATASQVGRQLIEDLECAAAAFQPESGKCEHIAARMLRRTNGRPSVASLANRLDVSERTLRRRFIAVLGMSPKTFARRLRVTGALLRAEKSSNPNWAQIAHAAGYHDQSHMIADFKLQTGMTPGETYAYRRSLSDFSNTAS